MQIAVKFRHMETSSALREYAEEKLSRVTKYIDEPVDAQVVFSVEKKIRNKAVVTLSAKGITIKAHSETEDMYATIDAVMDKLEKQLKRYKEKIKSHKPGSGKDRFFQKQIMAAESIDTGSPVPEIIRDTSFSVKPMSMDEAVMQMDLLDKDFLVFTDATSDNMNVVYRRKDGNYGIIAPKE